MRVVVTGSSGQIGTNLALLLQREGHDVFGVDKRVNADLGKARDLLGYRPRVPLEEGVALAVEWFRANAQHAEGLTDAPVPQDADFKLAATS